MSNLDSVDNTRGLTDKIKRYTKVSKSAVGILARLLGEGYLGMAFDKDAHATNLKDMLGDLKGPMMKAAQLLATIPGALPEEYTQELMDLQSNAPPMGWLFVKRRMSQELGPNWQSRFQSFDHYASAAASLGQVHRAVHHDGTLLACKLQYPDMTSTIADDLGQLKILLSFYERVSNALDTENLFNELKERLGEELNYRKEAQHIRHYQQILHDVSYVHIPMVSDDLSTARLLTMTWLEGKPILELKQTSQDVRNLIAQRMFHIWYTPFYTYGVIHGDPHLGNYTVREDYSINLLDFGCIRFFSGAFIHGVIDLYHALQTQNQELAVQAYTQWGFKNISKDLIEVLNLWARFLFDPLLDDSVRTIHAHHGATYGREIAAKVHSELNRIGGVCPPQEFVMMDRAAVGMGGVFMHLNAQLNWHQLYEEMIQNFSAKQIEANQKGLLD